MAATAVVRAGLAAAEARCAALQGDVGAAAAKVAATAEDLVMVRETNTALRAELREGVGDVNNMDTAELRERLTSAAVGRKAAEAKRDAYKKKLDQATALYNNADRGVKAELKRLAHQRREPQRRVLRK